MKLTRERWWKDMTRGKLKVGDKEWIIVIIESSISEGWQKMMFP